MVAANYGCNFTDFQGNFSNNIAVVFDGQCPQYQKALNAEQVNIFVLFCFVLFCFVLFCFVLFCFVLFCFVLFCFVLFCFVLFIYLFIFDIVIVLFFDSKS